MADGGGGKLAGRVTDQVGGHGSGKLGDTAGMGLLTGALLGLAVGVALGVAVVAGAVLIGATGGLAAAAIAGAVLGGVSMTSMGAAAGLQWDVADKNEKAQAAAKSKKAGCGCSTVTEGWPDVTIEGQPATTVSKANNHSSSKMAEGSTNVLVHGLPLCRDGDKASCGGFLISTAQRTFIGPPASSSSGNSVGGENGGGGPGFFEGMWNSVTGLFSADLWKQAWNGDTQATIQLLNGVSLTTGLAGAAVSGPVIGAGRLAMGAGGTKIAASSIGMGQAMRAGAPTLAAGTAGGMVAGHYGGQAAGAVGEHYWGEKGRIIGENVGGLGAGIVGGAAAGGGVHMAQSRMGRGAAVADLGAGEAAAADAGRPPGTSGITRDNDMGWSSGKAAAQMDDLAARQTDPVVAAKLRDAADFNRARAAASEDLYRQTGGAQQMPTPEAIQAKLTEMRSGGGSGQGTGLRGDPARVTADTFEVRQAGYQTEGSFGSKAASAVNDAVDGVRDGRLNNLDQTMDYLADRRRQMAFEGRGTDPNSIMGILDGTDGFGKPREVFDTVEPLNLRGFTGLGDNGKYGFARARAVEGMEPGGSRTIFGEIDGQPVELTTITNGDPPTMWNTPSANIPKVRQQAARLYEEAMDPALSPEATVEKVGELHWWLSHGMVYERGSAAITDMTAKTILSAKGIKTPPWKQGVAPDIEALISSDPKAYAKNYRNLFDGPVQGPKPAGAAPAGPAANSPACPSCSGSSGGATRAPSPRNERALVYRNPDGSASGAAGPGAKLEAVNLFGSGNKRQGVRNITPMDGVVDVRLHGTKENVVALRQKGQGSETTGRGATGINPETGAQSLDAAHTARLLNRMGVPEGQEVRLISCDTGALPEGFASDLARTSGRDVIAPDRPIDIHDSGHMTGPNGEPVTWTRFKPDGTSEVVNVSDPGGLPSGGALRAGPDPKWTSTAGPGDAAAAAKPIVNPKVDGAFRAAFREVMGRPASADDMQMLKNPGRIKRDYPELDAKIRENAAKGVEEKPSGEITFDAQGRSVLAQRAPDAPAPEPPRAPGGAERPKPATIEDAMRDAPIPSRNFDDPVSLDAVQEHIDAIKAGQRPEVRVATIEGTGKQVLYYGGDREVYAAYRMTGEEPVIVDTGKKVPGTSVKRWAFEEYEGDKPLRAGIEDDPLPPDQLPPRRDRFFVRAGELAEDGNMDRVHGVNDAQLDGDPSVGHGGVRNLSNEDLVRYGGPAGDDPIRGGRSYRADDSFDGPGPVIVLRGGHHRAHEIAARVRDGRMSPDTLVEMRVEPGIDLLSTMNSNRRVAPGGASMGGARAPENPVANCPSCSSGSASASGVAEAASFSLSPTLRDGGPSLVDSPSHNFPALDFGSIHMGPAEPGPPAPGILHLNEPSLDFSSFVLDMTPAKADVKPEPVLLPGKRTHTIEQLQDWQGVTPSHPERYSQAKGLFPGEQTGNTCGLMTCGQIIEARTGVRYTEADLIAAAGTDQTPTGLTRDGAVRLLENNGVAVTKKESGLSLNRLVDYVDAGHGVMVTNDVGKLAQNPALSGLGHSMTIVDVLRAPNGDVTHFVVNETSRGGYGPLAPLPVDKFYGSLTGSALITEQPIWGRTGP